jgi:Na+/H+ antiporter
MHEFELIAGLLVAVCVLVALANRIQIPYPMVLLVGGIALSFVPGLPEVTLDPELALVLFLPPVLFAAAYFTSWRDFRANARAISLLAFGLVLTTTVLVAVVAHMTIDGMNWATAFVLGAIVSPPDAVAATSIFQRLGVPGRVTTILEGESLVNDASALVAYRFAVVATVTGVFSARDAVLEFVVLCAGGVAFGLLVGVALARLIPLIREPSLGITVTLLAPFAAYIPAEELGFSGVLATVMAGLYFGRKAPTAFAPESRIRGQAVWDVALLLINGLVFILIGLQLSGIRDALEGGTLTVLTWQALAISAAVIVIRFAWVFPATYLPRLLVPGLVERDPAPHWRPVFIIAWSGLRGVVSLAAALALPVTLEDGSLFPFRSEIISIAFVVIVITLLGQGLLLPWIIRALDIHSDDVAEQEARVAKRAAAEAALARLKELEHEPWVPDDHIGELHDRYTHMLDHLSEDGESTIDEEHVQGYLRLRQETRDAARQAVLELRDRGEIGDEARRRVEATLDLDELRVEI